MTAPDTQDQTPRQGWRMAWRQIIPSAGYCPLGHSHGAAIFPASDRERLNAIVDKQNAGYRLEDGSRGIFTWLEWYDAAVSTEARCHGSYLNYHDGPLGMGKEAE